MAKISPLMIAPPLVFAGFVALAAFGMFRPDPEGLPSTLVGQMAPALPPAMTAPRRAASASISSTPRSRQRSTA